MDFCGDEPNLYIAEQGTAVMENWSRTAAYMRREGKVRRKIIAVKDAENNITIYNISIYAYGVIVQLQLAIHADVL